VRSGLLNSQQQLRSARGTQGGPASSTSGLSDRDSVPYLCQAGVLPVPWAGKECERRHMCARVPCHGAHATAETPQGVHGPRRSGGDPAGFAKKECL